VAAGEEQRNEGVVDDARLSDRVRQSSIVRRRAKRHRAMAGHVSEDRSLLSGLSQQDSVQIRKRRKP
jgi:hypothetical protein